MRESGWPEPSASGSVWAGEALYGALSAAGFTVIARHDLGHCYHGAPHRAFVSPARNYPDGNPTRPLGGVRRLHFSGAIHARHARCALCCLIGSLSSIANTFSCRSTRLLHVLHALLPSRQTRAAPVPTERAGWPRLGIMQSSWRGRLPSHRAVPSQVPT